MTVAELVAKLGLDIKREDWDRAQGAMDKLKGAATALVSALAVKRIAGALDDIIKGSVESAHHVELLSDQFEISTDKVQELGYAAKSIGQEGLTIALRQLARHAYEASRKGGEAGFVFARMGVRIHDAHGKLLPVDQLLEHVADGMQRVRNPTERMALATQLFGRSGAQMVKVLKDGSSGMRKMYGEAHRLGIMSKEMIELAHKEHQAQIEVDYRTKTLYNTIAEKLLPAKIWLLEKTQAVVEWFTKLARNTHIVQEGAMALSAALGFVAIVGFRAFLAVLGPLGTALFVFGAIMFFVIDDILTTLRGGKSVGREISDWAGDVYDKFMKWESISGVINAILKPIKALVESLKEAKDLLFSVIMKAMGQGNDADRYMKELYNEKVPAGEPPGRIEGAIEWVNQLSGGRLRNMVGVNPNAVITPSPQAAAAAASNPYNLGGMSTTINQTINAAPGQSEHEIANVSAKSISEAIDDRVEHAHHKLIPRVGGLAAAAGAAGGG